MNESKLHSMLDRAFAAIEKWRILFSRVEQERDVAVQKLKDYEKVNALYVESRGQWYAAQNELELLRTIRKSQGEAIAKLRLERDYANRCFEKVCKERDFKNRCFEQACKEVSAWQTEALQRRHQEMLIRHGYANPRLEMMLEESYRNEFKRNIDNQKATDAPNCPSS